MRKTLAFINAAIAIIIICLMVWTALSASLIHEDAAVIGGSDGPTAVWLTADKLDGIAYGIPVFCCALLLANTYALYMSTKGAKRRL
ncbi:MAG: hypothetical protein PHR35_16420 [Kiritimatiellae bacterium]|nr:hypothetical protein [Kiritimatiellia bacterium]